MKTAIRSLLVGYITFVMAAALVSCSKGDTPSPPPPKVDTIPAVKHAGQFVGNPTLSPDTSFARTAGTTLTFDYVYGSNATNTIGSMDESKKKVTLPAMESSTSCTLSITGEDGIIVYKTVPIPVFDTNFTFIVKNDKRWQQDGKDTLFWAGGYIAGSIDLNKYIYHRAIVNGKRSGTAIAPNGSTSTGWWNSLNNGTQFQNGGGIYDNVFLSETNWTLERHYISGGVAYTHRFRYKVVP